MLRSKLILQFVFLLLIGSGIVAGVYLVRESQEIREKAEVVNSLYVRVSKNYVKPGESYYLYVFDSYVPFHGYSGQLDVQVPTYTGIWKDFSGNPVQVDNGIAVINVPSGTQAFTVDSARFRPNPNTNNFDWSNAISQGIGTTSNLNNLADYYIMTNKEILFRGTNYTFSSPISFNSVIG